MNPELHSDTYTEKTNLPGIAHGLLLIAIALVLSLIFTPIINLLMNQFTILKPWMIFLNYNLSFGVLYFIAIKIYQVQKIEIQKTQFVLYLFLTPLVIAMAIIGEGVVSLLPMPDFMKKLFEEMVQFNLPSFLVIAVSAPLLEELIFRGVLLKGLLRKYNAKKAIIWSAILFGIAHANPWQFIPAFMIGIVIGWLYWKTKSILPGLFIHVLNNSLSFYLAYKYRDVNTTFKDIVGNNINYILLFILSMAICIVIIYALKRYFNQLHLKTIN